VGLIVTVASCLLIGLRLIQTTAEEAIGLAVLMAASVLAIGNVSLSEDQKKHYHLDLLIRPDSYFSLSEIRFLIPIVGVARG
jgi:hypothetical protein